jgi:hypothetical protein
MMRIIGTYHLLVCTLNPQWYAALLVVVIVEVAGAAQKVEQWAWDWDWVAEILQVTVQKESY